MRVYDPESSPDATRWLETDESERIELVSACHRRENVKLPNATLHAMIHVIVENQLALGEDVVARTLARLQREGLSRHDALHAIGSVLVDDIYQLMHENAERGDEVHRRYLERLERLTAKGWLGS